MAGAVRCWARLTGNSVAACPPFPRLLPLPGLVGRCATLAISAGPAPGPTGQPGIFEPVEVRQIGLERRYRHAQEADERGADRCPALKSGTGYPQTQCN